MAPDTSAPESRDSHFLFLSSTFVTAAMGSFLPASADASDAWLPAPRALSFGSISSPRAGRVGWFSAPRAGRLGLPDAWFPSVRATWGDGDPSPAGWSDATVAPLDQFKHSVTRMSGPWTRRKYRLTRRDLKIRRKLSTTFGKRRVQSIYT